LLLDRVQHLGEYLRYNTCLSPRLSEFTILITARHYTSNYEWFAHEPHALKQGLSPDIVEAVRQGRRPDGMQPDESAVYDFSNELLRDRKISDETYKRLVAEFGTQGAIDLAALIGYYVMLAMTIFAHEIPLPEGTPPPLPHI